MEFNIEIRRKQLENLDQFISSSKDRVDSILDYLGWNAEKITKNQKETVKCPINPSHRIPTSSVNTHVQNCIWKKEMYHKDDVPLSEPNPIPGSTIIIDDITKVNVLNNALTLNPQMKTGWRSSEPEPKTSDRLLATFTPDERLALYNFTVTSTKGPPQVPEFNIEPKIVEKHNLTPYELKALERDAKRRRIKYKAKSVHINSKSSTEILRELIDGQMELYEDWLQDKNEENSTSDNDIQKEFIEEKKNDQDDKLESSNEPVSPKSSKSQNSEQNSYKSQESRYKYRRSRSRSVERSRDRSRSHSRKYEHRREYRNDYSSRKRYDDRGFYDRSRKYDTKRHHSREYRDNSHSRVNRSDY